MHRVYVAEADEGLLESANQDFPHPSPLPQAGEGTVLRSFGGYFCAGAATSPSGVANSNALNRSGTSAIVPPNST